MPTFELAQYELHAMRYRVEATNEAKAIARLFAGEAETIEQSQDFIEIADQYGLPVDEHRDLATALRELGLMRGKAEVIPSIRSIDMVEDQPRSSVLQRRKKRKKNRHENHADR